MAAIAWVGCRSNETRGPALRGDDGFAVGRLPLALEPAPGGLCEGGGAHKECGPEGCAEGPTDTVNTAGAAQTSGQSAASAQGFTPTPGAANAASAPMSAAPSGAAPTLPVSPGAPGPGNNQAPPAAMTPSAGSAAPEPPAQAQCVPADAGLSGLADAGAPRQCEDGGVVYAAAASAALIREDVPGCAQVDPGTSTTLYLSADDSGSMAAPVIARRMIRAGMRVPAHVIRPWEFLNYYDFAFEPAARGDVRMLPQLSSCPEDGRLSLQVALQAEAREPDQRAPLNVTFVVDTSGSMGSSTLGGDTPIALARASVQALAARLRAGDVVSMVTWNTEQLAILSGYEITQPSDPILVAAAQNLTASGGTDLHSGLVHGYELAERFYAPERVNRLILISDGMANVGVTDEQLIAEHADDEEGEAGIYLAGVGVGDGFNDTLMNAVTDAGRGAYVYLDSLQEAERMLGERYLTLVDIAARAVRLEVTLPYYLVLETFFGEVASTDSAKVRPQHLGPNDAMLFFQVLRACDLSALHGDDRIQLRATWQTPFERERREQVIDTSLNQLAGDDAELTKAAAVAGYAEALAVVASAQDRAEAHAALEQALQHVQGAKDADSDPDLQEIADLLMRYLRLFP